MTVASRLISLLELKVSSGNFQFPFSFHNTLSIYILSKRFGMNPQILWKRDNIYLLLSESYHPTVSFNYFFILTPFVAFNASLASM